MSSALAAAVPIMPLVDYSIILHAMPRLAAETHLPHKEQTQAGVTGPFVVMTVAVYSSSICEATTCLPDPWGAYSDKSLAAGSGLLLTGDTEVTAQG